jgi:acyl carrier protein
MTTDALLNAMAEWIGEITEQPPPQLTNETDLVKDLALDSLAMAELGARVWLRYKVHVRASEVANAPRIGALVELVRTRLQPPSP